MKTDSFFYRFFLAFPEAFFTLIGQNKRKAKGYQFTSIEVKDIAFRFDGLFLPEGKSAHVYCVEAQFKKKPDFYPSFFGKIANYLQQYQPTNDWRAIVFYPNRAVDTGVHAHYREFFESGRIQRVYLSDLPAELLEKFPLNLLRIIIDSKQKVLATADKIVRHLPEQVPNEKHREIIIELLTNLLVSKLPQMTRKEIEKMFELADVKKSRFYREVADEVAQELTPKITQELTPKIAQEKARAIAGTMLNKNFSIALIAEITGLSQEEIHALSRETNGEK